MHYQATHICYDLLHLVIHFLTNFLNLRCPQSVPLYPMPGYSGIQAGEQWNVEFGNFVLILILAYNLK